MSYIETMKKRISVRTYTGKAIPEDVMQKVRKIIEQTENPFGAKVRFNLLESDNTEGRLGTYGFIRGPKVFIAGCLEKGDKDLEGYGYAFEKVILDLTELGLGTCWLGGTFKRGTFAKSAQLSEDEYLPAATPIGYAKQKKSFTERIVAASAGARKRINFSELFFDGDFNTSLKTDDQTLLTCLEMVRIAPSASNKQPWRVVKQGENLHFYLAKTKNYTGNKAFGFCMQKIDLGIAACHFEFAAKELGLKGAIAVNSPKIDTDYEYSFTWKRVQ